MALSQEINKLKEYTIRAKCKAESALPLGYTLYVFQNLDYKYLEEKYITLVRFPNWNNNSFSIDEEGYVHFKIVEAGKDLWYNNKEERFQYYNYTNCIFLEFIPITPKVENQIYVLD